MSSLASPAQSGDVTRAQIGEGDSPIADSGYSINSPAMIATGSKGKILPSQSITLKNIGEELERVAYRSIN